MEEIEEQIRNLSQKAIENGKKISVKAIEVAGALKKIRTNDESLAHHFETQLNDLLLEIRYDGSAVANMALNRQQQTTLQHKMKEARFKMEQECICQAGHEFREASKALTELKEDCYEYQLHNDEKTLDVEKKIMELQERIILNSDTY